MDLREARLLRFVSGSLRSGLVAVGGWFTVCGAAVGFLGQAPVLAEEVEAAPIGADGALGILGLAERRLTSLLRSTRPVVAANSRSAW
jgi:hypothetical protein